MKYVFIAEILFFHQFCLAQDTSDVITLSRETVLERSGDPQ